MRSDTQYTFPLSREMYALLSYGAPEADEVERHFQIESIYSRHFSFWRLTTEANLRRGAQRRGHRDRSDEGTVTAASGHGVRLSDWLGGLTNLPFGVPHGLSGVNVSPELCYRIPYGHEAHCL